jgi:hypothetical protein
MPIQNAPEGFRFKTSLLGTIFGRFFGFMLIWLSMDFLRGWLSPSWVNLPWLIITLAFGLLLLSWGSALLIGACDIEIADGQFRFRRLWVWKSVPLSAVSRARLWFPGVYVRLDYDGERHRLIFFPEDFKVRWYPLPTVRLLREVRRRNAEESARKR